MWVVNVINNNFSYIVVTNQNKKEYHYFVTSPFGDNYKVATALADLLNFQKKDECLQKEMIMGEMVKLKGLDVKIGVASPVDTYETVFKPNEPEFYNQKRVKVLKNLIKMF